MFFAYIAITNNYKLFIFKTKQTIMAKIPMAPRELAPEGNGQDAVCLGIVDLGTQPATNPAWDDARKCLIVFELVNSKRKNGKPFDVTKNVTFTMSQNGKLAEILEAWLGISPKELRKFDPDDLKGKPALLNIKHSEDGNFANIIAISAPPAKHKMKKASMPTYSLYLDETFDQDVFDGLSEGLKNKIAASPEYAAVMSGKFKKKPVPAKGRKK